VLSSAYFYISAPCILNKFKFFLPDLRVKLELSSRPEEHHVVNAAPYTETSADKISEIIPSNPWNSSTSTKLVVHKGGSVATADGNVIELFC
jgi:hypothetical protein